jgi:hypothetical protein
MQPYKPVFVRTNKTTEELTTQMKSFDHLVKNFSDYQYINYKDNSIIIESHGYDIDLKYISCSGKARDIRIKSSTFAVMQDDKDNIKIALRKKKMDVLLWGRFVYKYAEHTYDKSENIYFYCCPSIKQPAFKNLLDQLQNLRLSSDDDKCELIKDKLPDYRSSPEHTGTATFLMDDVRYHIYTKYCELGHYRNTDHLFTFISNAPFKPLKMPNYLTYSNTDETVKFKLIAKTEERESVISSLNKVFKPGNYAIVFGTENEHELSISRNDVIYIYVYNIVGSYNVVSM